jgi:hypothetical protein
MSRMKSERAGSARSSLVTTCHYTDDRIGT